MKVEQTELNGVLLIKPYIFEDYRGYYIETFNEDQYTKLLGVKFVQDDIAWSHKHVLRGIHGDYNTYKLVSCLYGQLYLVVVNCDKQSEEFGKWLSFIISGENHYQVLVPPKHGNSFLVLSDGGLFHYKQSTYYDRSGQFTYQWNDTRFNIEWPIDKPILSTRDKGIE